MAKITIQLDDTDVANHAEKYDDGDLQSGAFVRSTNEDSDIAISTYVFDTCDANYKKFAADTLAHWPTTNNTDFIRLKEILEEANDCSSIIIKASVVYPIFSNALPDAIKGRGMPVNAIPMAWAKRYFTQMISEKDPLFEYKIDLLDKIIDTSTGENLSAKTLEKLIQDAKSEGENKNLFKIIFGSKNAETPQNVTVSDHNDATFEKILKHYREETLYTRSTVLIKDKPYIVTVFTDPSCQFVSVEFKSSDGLRFEFSTLDTESKLPITFDGNALGLSDDIILATLGAVAKHYESSNHTTQPLFEIVAQAILAQLPTSSSPKP